MSWADVENDSVDMAENPYPEEDSDLPQRQHQNGEGLGLRGEEDGPEEDLVIPQENVIAGNAQNISADEVVLRLGQNVDGALNPASGCKNDQMNSDSPNVQVSDADKASAMQSSNIDNVQDEDSFEQDEETTAPECENEVIHEACSESDRQLFQHQVLSPSQSSESSIQVLHSFRHPESEHLLVDQETSSIMSEVIVSSDMNLQPNAEPACSFTGDIQVVNNFDDAPEAEVCNLLEGGETNHYEEEDNLRLCVGPENSEILENGIPLPGSDDQFDAVHTHLEVRNEISIPRENFDLTTSESVDNDLQNPECDRENVSYGHQQIQPVKAAELANSVQSLCDNNSCGPQHSADNITVKVMDQSCDGSSLLLSEHVPGDVKRNLPFNNLSKSSNIEPSGINNNVPSISEAEGTDLEKTDNISKTKSPDLSLSDNTLFQPADNGSENELSGQSSNDCQNYIQQADTIDHSYQPSDSNKDCIQITHVVIHYDQPNSTQASKNSSSIISAEENHSLAITTSVQKKEASLNSMPQSLTADLSRSSCQDHNSQTYPSRSSSLESTTPSENSSPARLLSQTLTLNSNHVERELALALQSDDDELLHELDAELLSHASRTKSPQRSNKGRESGPTDSDNSGQIVNGVQSYLDFRQMQELNKQLLEQLKIRDEEIDKLTHERDTIKETLNLTRSQTEEQQRADNLYLPQIQMLENTVAQQQDEIKALKEKLISHDSAARKAVTTLQNELKSRVDQITKMYEECLKEKDMMVLRFAESEAKNMEAKRVTEKVEAKLKEAIKEKDSMVNALKTAKLDKQKAVTNLETKSAEASNFLKELDKMKEAVNSSEYRIKWFQNKLKDELDSHKETKASLEKTTNKLKEAREETEIIRKECQAIVKRYQESEEIKSNSLDKELKLKETELRTQKKERNDTEEIHQMTKKELESLKSHHKDTAEEVKTLKDKVHCLEEERKQNHQMIENYQEIMQRQKSENMDLKAKIASLVNLEEDFKRAQEMIQSLDKDIADLKIVNRDFQKDLQSCRERESKMLSLQSELSGTNAHLRSENTNLSNKASMLTGEVEKLKMEIQELETTVKDLSDKYEEEKTKRKEETEKLGASLADKITECSELKQKWEDEIDNNKTLKRRHANNVKDLTRQLQQIRKKVDSLEGKGDSGSMGSRTNSVGSLNSVDNSSQPTTSVHQPAAQEFPVITEQVEVDKQLLIERIVRLQKAHARKNEKLEFLGEHIQQLLEEIRKKNKIIQSYALREESGILSSEDMDANKTLLARKGGIMASVYSVHQQDGSMTLELSLQINQKLQAVLEDTLLKNITLKESLDTLGAEIARLSQENRKLQLKLREVDRHLTT